MEKIIRFAGYFIYTVFALYLLSLGMLWERKLQITIGQTYSAYPGMLLYMAVFPVLFGVLLAVPQFIAKVNSRGRWYYDWVVFFAAGLPALYADMAVLLFFSPVGGYLPKFDFLLTSTVPGFIGGIVFGYLILSSIKKCL